VLAGGALGMVNAAIGMGILPFKSWGGGKHRKWSTARRIYTATPFVLFLHHCAATALAALKVYDPLERVIGGDSISTVLFLIMVLTMFSFGPAMLDRCALAAI